MSGGVGVNIFSHFHPEGVLKAIAEFKKLDTASQKAQFGIKKAAIPAAAALAGLAVAATHAVHAAMENEVSQMRFDKVMQNVTGSTKEQMAAINESVDAMSKQTGITREQLRPALQYLTVATGSVSTAQKDMSLAMDISAATGADLETVTKALGKAHNGVTKGLVALDPSLKKVLGTTKDFTVIQDLLTQKFAGSEAAFEGTAAGGMRVFQNSIHEMWVSIGNSLLPVFKAVIPYLQQFGEWAAAHSGTFVKIAAAVGLFSAAILVANTVLKVMAIWEAIVDAANPFALIAMAVLALIAIVVGLYMKFEIVRTVVNTVINAIIASIQLWINIWIKIINLVIDGINLMIKGANFFGAGLTELGHIGEVQFGRIGGAAKNAAKSISDFHRMEAADQGSTKAIETTTTAFTGAGKVVETVKEKIKKYTDALKSETSAQKDASSASKDVTKAQTALMAAQTKTSDAMKAFNLVAHGYGAESKQAAEQTTKVAQAQRDLISANNGVKDATKAVMDAELKLQKLREKPSAETIDGAEIGLQKSRFNVEQATFDIADAEQTLADLRTKGDATPEEIRKAEIALAETKFALRDATLAVRDSEDSLKKLREDTPTADDIATAERDLADAKMAVEQASADQRDATIKLNDETLLYSQIVSGAAEDSSLYRDALKELQDAQKDEADAIDNVTAAKDRELEMTLKLAEAEQALQDVKNNVGAGIVAKATTQAATALADAQDAIVAAHSTTNGATSDFPRGLDFASLQDLFNFGGMPRMAAGGVVTRPTIAMIGESGAEAIIPLSQMNGMGGSINITVNAGMGVNGAELGQQIIDEIRKAERRSGRVFASA